MTVRDVVNPYIGTPTFLYTLRRTLPTFTYANRINAYDLSLDTFACIFIQTYVLGIRSINLIQKKKKKKKDAKNFKQR
jgi:hypothetical protein